MFKKAQIIIFLMSSGNFRVNVKISFNSQHRGKPGILDNDVTGSFIRNGYMLL